MRAKLQTLIFGQAGLPSSVPTVGASAASPLGPTGEPLTLDVGGEVTTAWHYVATAPNGRLVIVHQGHTSGVGDAGISETVNALLGAGFDVVFHNMPGFHGNGGASNHDYSGQANGLRFFIEPVVAAVNLLASSYSDVSMTGISGGGWTTTVAAAVDQRITLSIPVAGSLPRRLRVSPDDIGDWEQSEVYEWGDYPALYALGCDSDGRRQVQVLNRHDSCCFAHSSYGDDYAADVVSVCELHATLAGGSFAFSEDTSHSTHKISQWTIDNVILPELGGSPLPPPPPPLIVDNVPPAELPSGTFALTGPVNAGTNPTGIFDEWGYWVGSNRGYAMDEYAGRSLNVDLGAEWLFTGLDPGTYQVEASYTGHANRASNTPYRILDDQAEVWSGTVSQQGSGNVTLWNVLGSVSCTSGVLRVKLEATPATNGYVIADAVRITEV